MTSVRAHAAEVAAPLRRRVERRRPDLRVVEPGTPGASPGRSPLSLLGTAAVVLLFVAFFGVVVFQVLLVQAQFRLDDLGKGLQVEEARARDLRLEAATLEAPERIVRDARDRLGMIPPSDVVYLQPKADDDRRAAFDPAHEQVPTTTVPAPVTPPTTAWKPPATTPTTVAGKATTTPTTAKPAATPTTTAKTTTTTAKPVTTTTPTTAYKPPTTTTGATTR